MTWVKLDDKFWANPKVLEVGNEASGAFARMLAYCGDHATDGRITADIARFIACTHEPLEKLVSSGLLKFRNGAYFIPDFLEYNPSREGLEAQRQADRDRKRERKDSEKNPEGIRPESSASRARARRVGSSRGSSSTSERQNGKGPNRSVARVSGKEVTDAEHDLASSIVAAFNENADSAYTVDAHLTPLVGRIREHPDLDAAEHARIIAANFAQPWWEDRPGPEVIYGNRRQFERSVERAKSPPIRAVKTGGSAASRADADIARMGELAERVRAEDAA